MRITRSNALVLIQEIRKLAPRLNEWEQGFLTSLEDHREILPLSEKQSKCLINIYKKASGGGQYERRQVLGLKKKSLNSMGNRTKS